MKSRMTIQCVLPRTRSFTSRPRGARRAPLRGAPRGAGSTRRVTMIICPRMASTRCVHIEETRRRPAQPTALDPPGTAPPLKTRRGATGRWKMGSYSRRRWSIEGLISSRSLLGRRLSFQSWDVDQVAGHFLPRWDSAVVFPFSVSCRHRFNAFGMHRGQIFLLCAI